MDIVSNFKKLLSNSPFLHTNTFLRNMDHHPLRGSFMKGVSKVATASAIWQNEWLSLRIWSTEKLNIKCCGVAFFGSSSCGESRTHQPTVASDFCTTSDKWITFSSVKEIKQVVLLASSKAKMKLLLLKQQFCWLLFFPPLLGIEFEAMND